MTTCVDCGAEIVEFPSGSGRWAREINYTLTVEKDFGQQSRTYEFCCRVLYDTSDDPPYRVLRADYHHPPGTVRRNFTAPAKP